MVWKRVQNFEGNRSESLIYHGGDGYYYHLNNNRARSRFAYLRCVKGDRGPRSCRGTAKALKSLSHLLHMQPHYHGPDLLYPSEVQLRKDIKEVVRSGNPAPYSEIVHAAGHGYEINVRMRLPPARLASTLNRIRSATRPPVPHDVGVLGASLLQEEYRSLTKSKVLDENIFAGVCGTMGDGTLSLVFISPWMRQFMGTRNRVFADGTWRRLSKRPKCGQLYTLCGIWRHHAIPMMRALMLRKTEEAYDTLIDYVKILVPDFSPHEIMCDHEKAQVNSWCKKFIDALVRGCLWHFAVAIWRHAKHLGLHDLMQEEEVVCSIVRAACALALLPTEDIEIGLEDLGWEAWNSGWMPQLREFFKYLNDEWMPRVATLSVFEAVDRTNNICESANRSYNKLVKVSRPSIFTILDSFVTLHDQGVLDIMSLINGFGVSRNRKVSALRNDQRIKRYSEDFSNGDITRLQFLHRASRRMQGVFQLAFQFDDDSDSDSDSD